MKKLLIAVILATSIPAMASGVDADSRAAALALAGSQSASSVTINGPSDEAAKASADAQVAAAHELANGTQTIKSAPSVYAPNIVTSNDTCMGSSSFGASAVGFGISVGSSWTDANCVMLKNAREMYNMGMPDVAFARLCMDPLNKEAIELTGKVCPQTTRDEKIKADKASAQAAK